MPSNILIIVYLHISLFCKDNFIQNEKFSCRNYTAKAYMLLTVSVVQQWTVIIMGYITLQLNIKQTH